MYQTNAASNLMTSLHLKDKEVRDYLLKHPNTKLKLFWDIAQSHFTFFGVDSDGVECFQIITWNQNQPKTSKTIEVALTIAKDLGFTIVCFQSLDI